MKITKYIAAFAAATTLLLAASCKKETPADLPQGKSDTEYIDDVLSTAVKKVDIADFLPQIKCYTDLIKPIMANQKELGAQKWISDLLKEIADDKTTEIPASRFAKVLRFTDGKSFAEDSETDASLVIVFDDGKNKADFTIQWGEETFDATVSIDKESLLERADAVMDTEDGYGELLPLGRAIDEGSQDGGEPSNLKTVTIKVPKNITLQGTYNGASLVSGSLGIETADALIVNDGPEANFNAIIKLVLLASGYEIQASNLKIGIGVDPYSTAYSGHLEFKAKGEQVVTANLSYEGREAEDNFITKIHATGNIIGQLAISADIPDFGALKQASRDIDSAEKAAAANGLQTIDLFYGSEVRSHNVRNAEIVYAYDEEESDYAMTMAFRSKEFAPESIYFFNPNNLTITFPKTVAQVMGKFTWIRMKFGGVK